MEIEAKFAITGALAPERISALKAPPYTIREAGVEWHSDVLLDTPSRFITGARNALRIRTIGQRRILTLKGPNQGVEGVHEREELEEDLPGPLSLDPHTWPAEIGDQALQLTHGESLSALLRVRVERRLWTVRRPGRIVAELALDSGEVIAAGRRQPLHELELELKGSGTRADLESLSAVLQASLPLTPESRSKLQRGLALLHHARWAFDGYTPLETAVRHVIHVHLRAMLHAQRLVIEQGDADAIHDMRVATRRIRTTLQAMEGAGVFSDMLLRSLRGRLRNVADALGELRDLDIFLLRIREWVGADGARERDLEPLRNLLAARRLAGYEQLVRRLSRKKYAHLFADLRQFIGEPAQPAEGEPCLLTRHYVGAILWPRYEAILRYETVIADAEPPTLHRLRIACKRLRYALEIFATPLGAGVGSLRKALVAAQSHLGDVQDLTVALARVMEASKRDPGNNGLLEFAQALQDERERLIARVDTVWEPLRGQRAREALIAGLTKL